MLRTGTTPTDAKSRELALPPLLPLPKPAVAAALTLRARVEGEEEEEEESSRRPEPDSECGRAPKLPTLLAPSDIFR